MKIRQDNRGLTLVELIIAIAVTTIVMGAVTMFMYSAQKSYRIAKETIDLQIEAQILMEQLGNWVMECNRVEKTSAPEAVGDVLILYEIPQNNGRDINDWKPVGYTAESTDATKRVIWARDGRLYMKKFTGIADADTDSTSSFDYAANATQENCIGELVQQFILVYDETDAPNRLSVQVILKKGNLTYELKDEFKIRNDIIPRTTIWVPSKMRYYA